MKYLFHNFLATLRRYKASSLLNVLGMAVAFAAFYVILTQVSYNLSYNRKLPDVDKLFVLSTPSDFNDGKYSLAMCRPIGEKLMSGSPLVQSGGQFTTTDGAQKMSCWINRDGTGRKLNIDLESFSLGAMEAYGFQTLSGSLQELERPRTIALQERVAKQYDLAVGDKISWSDPQGLENTREVVAIFADFAHNTDLYWLDGVYLIRDHNLNNVSEWSYLYVVKLQDATDKAAFEEYAKGGLREFIYLMYSKSGFEGDNLEKTVDDACERLEVKLFPVSGMFYENHLDWVMGRSGNRSTDLTLLAVAILTIVIALINFVNFFFALVPVRLRSVNTYKVFGVSRASLVGNFMAEAAGLVLLGLLLAGVLVQLFLACPLSDILRAPAAYGQNLGIALITVVVALLAGMAGSIYPALYITSFQPALVLKGSFSGSRSGRQLRNALIVFQFIISIMLIISAVFIRLQHSYMMDYDMGFNKEHLLSGKMPLGICWYGDQNRAFEDKLRSNPDIVDLTWADGELVNTSRMGWGREYKGNRINFQCYPVAYNFLDFMGIDIVEGRDFQAGDELSESSSMIFNRQAQKDYDIDLETRAPGHQDNTVTVGICEDFLFKPLQYGKADFAFYVFGKDHQWREGLRNLYVRTAPGADALAVMEFIRQTVQELRPDADPDSYDIDFFDRELGRQYRQERQLSTLISIFTVIAIIISLMGVFGLVLFDTQHRSREIAIRRVMGADVKGILRLFNRKYILIVLVSFLLAAPGSWLVMRAYLSHYAYHTPLYAWVFLLALAAVLAITVVIVSLRSLEAATSNPVNHLKNE